MLSCTLNIVNFSSLQVQSSQVVVLIPKATIVYCAVILWIGCYDLVAQSLWVGAPDKHMTCFFCVAEAAGD